MTSLILYWTLSGNGEKHLLYEEIIFWKQEESDKSFLLGAIG